MSDTPRKLRCCWRDGKWHTDELANLADRLERENTILRNYLMTLASDGAKPGDAKTLWRRVRGEML